MIRKFATIIAALACMAPTLQCKCATTNDVIVQFKQGVHQGEAKWILYTYSSNFKVEEPGTCELHLKAATREPIKRDIRRTKDYLSSQHLKAGEVSISSDGVEATIALNSPPQDKVRKGLQKELPPDLNLIWQCDAFSAVLRVPIEYEKEVIGLLRKEVGVQNAYDSLAPNASSIEGIGNVEGTGTVHVPPNSTAPPNSPRGGRVRQLDIRSSSLPSSETITTILKHLYGQKTATVNLRKEDEEKQVEYYSYDVDHVRGAITRQENYWERLHLSIPIYAAGKDEIRIRVIMSGEYAPGLGDREPSTFAYRSLEPTYTSDLQSNLDRFIVALSNSIKRRGH